MTGFLAKPKSNQVHGRPVGVVVAAEGPLLVADDGANKVWRVSVKTYEWVLNKRFHRSNIGLLF